MPRDEKQVLRVFLIALFALWSLYVAFFYRRVEAMPPLQHFVLHESARFIVFAGLPLYWTFRRADTPLTTLGFRFSWRSLALGIGIGLGYAAAGVLAGVFLQGQEFHPRYDEVSFWARGFGLATLVEELSFRSFLLGVLHFRRPALAVIFSAACFALIHVPGWCFLHLVPSGAALATQLASVFLLGCVLAVVSRHTRSFYAVFAIHALNNVAAATLQQAASTRRCSAYEGCQLEVRYSS